MHHSFDADDIEVAVEHERRSVAGSNPRYDVRATRNALYQLYVKAPVVEHGGEGTSAITLARRIRSEGGISGIVFIRARASATASPRGMATSLPSFRALS